MAIRTTEAAVRAISGIKDTVDVSSYIDVATNIVDDIEATGDSCLNDAKLELIERYLAAHFASLVNRRVTSKSIAGASTSFEGSVSGEGFDLTPFGQQAKLLDCTGLLSELPLKKVSMTWLGTISDD